MRGMEYAVNGMAASNRYRPIQAVIIDPKIDIGPIISRGLTLCKWQNLCAKNFGREFLFTRVRRAVTPP